MINIVMRNRCKGHGIDAITVRGLPGGDDRALVNVGGRVFSASMGRSGRALLKREGDGATPIARMSLLYGFYRADRVPRPRTSLVMKPITASLGWCDDSGNASYNRPVTLPFNGGCEQMMRGDGLYDICLVMDWNVRERRRNMGSAIFFHLKADPERPTEGCIAIGQRDMVWMLERVHRGTAVIVMP